MRLGRRPQRPQQAESSRAELWTWPLTAGATAFLAALGLAQYRPPSGSWVAVVAWPGDVSSASTVLQTLATAAITTISLTFSVTVVGLQLASQQFSPRLMRDFVRDRVTKATMAVLVGTFVFAVTLLRGVHADDDVPAVGVLVAFLTGLCAVGTVVLFITHIARMLRVETMMLTVHDDAVRAIRTFYPDHTDTRPRSPDELDLDRDSGSSVYADRSGFVRMVDVDALVRSARRNDAVVWVEARPGDHVVRGTPVATVWLGQGDGADLAEAVRAAVVVGYERTVEQDAAFGFRQLTDIAVKALSPGVNDPTTAAHCVGHIADLLAALSGRLLGPTLHADSEGTGRVVVEDRDFRYYLDLVCGEVRRFGRHEPTVLTALLRMLRDVGSQVRHDNQVREIERQIRLVLAEVPSTLTEEDRSYVEEVGARARAALAGREREAFRDRSGETRST